LIIPDMEHRMKKVSAAVATAALLIAASAPSFAGDTNAGQQFSHKAGHGYVTRGKQQSHSTGKSSGQSSSGSAPAR
jgi:Spy/CpxP family protein refolding chaperone